jgi:hypothetical protein
MVKSGSGERSCRAASVNMAYPVIPAPIPKEKNKISPPVEKVTLVLFTRRSPTPVNVKHREMRRKMTVVFRKRLSVMFDSS